jgi:hypothetical protein
LTAISKSQEIELALSDKGNKKTPRDTGKGKEISNLDHWSAGRTPGFTSIYTAAQPVVLFLFAPHHPYHAPLQNLRILASTAAICMDFL